MMMRGGLTGGRTRGLGGSGVESVMLGDIVISVFVSFWLEGKGKGERDVWSTRGGTTEMIEEWKEGGRVLR